MCQMVRAPYMWGLLGTLGGGLDVWTSTRLTVLACRARGIAGVGRRSVRTHGVVHRRSTRAQHAHLHAHRDILESTIMNQIECRAYI